MSPTAPSGADAAAAAPPTIRIHPADNVVIARRQLLGGTVLAEEGGLVVTGLVPPGHKIATQAIAAGDAVRRYDQVIGHATQAIAPGQHVHTHNLAFASFARTHDIGAGALPTVQVPDPATFLGIVRPDGRVATRNYIGVLTSVNCSATAARAIADHFRRDIRPEALADYPNVDGVVALTHGMGCATASVGVIRGGTQPNIVPDHCVISIDRRTLPGETEAGVRRELARLLAKRRLQVTFDEEKAAPCRPMETDPARPEVRRFMSSVGQRRALGVNFFCDAAVLSEAGIPSVVFGPGDIAQAHTADEWISASSLERGWRMLVHYLRSLP